MSASGPEAAGAEGRAGPPRLAAVPGGGNGRPVAVPGGGNGRPVAVPDRVVVFLGVADDVRSRVAAALLATRSKGRVRAVSASPIALAPDPAVAACLAELGVDLGAVATLPPSPALLEQAQLVVVMGYDRHHPADGRRTEDWCIDDLRGKDPDTVRCLRDALDRRVQRLLIRMGVALPAGPR